MNNYSKPESPLRDAALATAAKLGIYGIEEVESIQSALDRLNAPQSDAPGIADFHSLFRAMDRIQGVIDLVQEVEQLRAAADAVTPPNPSTQ